MEILRASHLCKTYGKGENEVRALDDVSFSIEKGEFVAIVGTSGSGKSTLMHILGGVDRPDSGSVYMDGQDIYKQNDEQLAIFRRRQVGLIFDGCKAFCTDDVFHAAGILHSDFGINTECHQPAGKQGVTFIDRLCDLAARFCERDLVVFIDSDITVFPQIFHCHTDAGL